MEPKFQSSFIPKGPVSSSASASMGQRKVSRDIFSFLAGWLFIISLVLAAGVFAFKFYLNYQIDRMGTELESARVALSPETIKELTRLNNRIVSTEELVSKHRIISPIFSFLSTATPKSVRYNNFDYAMTDKGLALTLRGEARSYSALALLSQVFNKNSNFKNTVFSNLSLDEEGNVLFSLTTSVDQNLLSYEKVAEKSILPAPVSAPATDSTSQSLIKTASSTAATTSKTTN